MRGQPPPANQNMQYPQQAVQPLNQPAQQFNQNSYAQPQQEEDDYDVYNMELPSYPVQTQAPTQRQTAVPSDDDDSMYFTSVDTERQKRANRKPINPKDKQQQKGLFSKFFNKDMP